MLYKIEFLTIEKMKVKRDYEIYNCSGWQTAVNRFMDLEKFYDPFLIWSVSSFNKENEKWYDELNQDELNSLNIDLGFILD